MERRAFLNHLVACGGVLAGTAIAGPPIVTALSPVFRRRPEPMWRRLGLVDQFPQGQMSAAVASLPRDDWPPSLGEKGVYVFHSADDEWIIFSRHCTDLGCPVVWDEGSHCFFCPCHGGVFSIEGDPMKGPPPRPLYRYEARVRDGSVEIDVNSVPAVF